MKRKIFRTIFIIITLLITINILGAIKPSLKVTNQHRKIEVLKCPFSWNTLLSGKHWDYPTPPELANKINAITVEPGAVLDFSFSKRPDNFEVSLWNNGSQKYESNDNGIIAPKEKGTYVFSVIGHWSKGQILYVFKVSVK